MELKDTIKLMTSDDYDDRFLAEYFQLEIRIQQLEQMIKVYYTGTLDLASTCPIQLLERQLKSMKEYYEYLQMRSIAEQISIVVGRLTVDELKVMETM